MNNTSVSPSLAALSIFPVSSRTGGKEQVLDLNALRLIKIENQSR